MSVVISALAILVAAVSVLAIFTRGSGVNSPSALLCDDHLRFARHWNRAAARYQGHREFEGIRNRHLHDAAGLDVCISAGAKRTSVRWGLPDGRRRKIRWIDSCGRLPFDEGGHLTWCCLSIDAATAHARPPCRLARDVRYKTVGVQRPPHIDHAKKQNQQHRQNNRLLDKRAPALLFAALVRTRSRPNHWCHRSHCDTLIVTVLVSVIDLGIPGYLNNELYVSVAVTCTYTSGSGQTPPLGDPPNAPALHPHSCWLVIVIAANPSFCAAVRMPATSAAWIKLCAPYCA